MDRFNQAGNFLIREGLAKQRGMRNLCRKKACLVSTDQPLLINLLYELSNAVDCYEVKLSVEARAGTYIGFCQFTNDSAVGDLWARYESHPRLWVIVHDEDFCEDYRAKIRSYQT